MLEIIFEKLNLDYETSLGLDVLFSFQILKKQKKSVFSIQSDIVQFDYVSTKKFYIESHFYSHEKILSEKIFFSQAQNTLRHNVINKNSIRIFTTFQKYVEIGHFCFRL